MEQAPAQSKDLVLEQEEDWGLGAGWGQVAGWEQGSARATGLEQVLDLGFPMVMVLELELRVDSALVLAEERAPGLVPGLVEELVLAVALVPVRELGLVLESEMAAVLVLGSEPVRRTESHSFQYLLPLSLHSNCRYKHHSQARS